MVVGQSKKLLAHGAAPAPASGWRGKTHATSPPGPNPAAPARTAAPSPAASADPDSAAKTAAPHKDGPRWPNEPDKNPVESLNTAPARGGNRLGRRRDGAGAAGESRQPPPLRTPPA